MRLFFISITESVIIISDYISDYNLFNIDLNTQ